LSTRRESLDLFLRLSFLGEFVMGRCWTTAVAIGVWTLFACSGDPAQGQIAGSPKRRALLVGIDDYQHPGLIPLKYAARDVTDLAVVLKQSGYEVVVLTDESGRADAKLAPTKVNLERELAAMSARCRRGDTFVLALAGHGLQFGTTAYFCPQDARPLEGFTDTLVSVSKIYESLEGSFAGTKLVLIDACRNDPTPGRGRSGIDADAAPPPQGVGVLFSCNRNQRAYEHDTLKHGIFFHYVLEGLKGQARDSEGAVTFEGLALYVRKSVPNRVQQLFPGVEQIPNLKADLAGVPVLIDSIPTLPRVNVKKNTLKNTLGMEFVLCPAGEFLMGTPPFEPGVAKNENQHKVILTQSFYLGIHEVTVGQFRRFVESQGYRTEGESNGLGSISFVQAAGNFQRRPEFTWRNPGFAQADNHPVTCVSWNDAQAFCQWLSRQEVTTYRLPTEAEWEYACRAGSKTAFSFGNDPEGLAKNGNGVDATFKRQFGNHWNGIAGEDGFVYTAPVGSFQANAFGLHDMHGNVWEWCVDLLADYPAGTVTNPVGTAPGAISRVTRGGMWAVEPYGLRSGHRGFGGAQGVGGSHLGFRVVRVPSAK